jgi:L-amino acid N-acyltransferase YncA
METLCRLSYWGEQATRIHAMASSPASVRVVAMTPEHADDVLRIYEAGIDSGDATFEPAAPSWPEFDAKFRPEVRFVALSPDGSVLGWVALSSVSSRRVYAGVAEVSVYVSPDAARRGVGRALLDAAIEASEAADIWTLQAGIFPENAASLALHAKAGFRTVGIRERMGRHGDRWRDVVLLERRSLNVE